MSDSSYNDLRRLWQEQPSGAPTMTEVEILSRARKLQIDARTEVIGISVVSVGFALLLFIGSLFEVLRGNGVGFWTLGWLLCTALLVPCFALIARAYFGFLWPRPFDPDIDVTESLQFCRRELRRRQVFSRELWRRSVPVFFIGVGMIILAGIRSVVTGTLGAGSVVGLVALGVWLRKRDGERIESQLIELDLLGASTGPGRDGREPGRGRRPVGTLTVVLIWFLILVAAVIIYSLVRPSS